MKQLSLLRNLRIAKWLTKIKCEAGSWKPEDRCLTLIRNPIPASPLVRPKSKHRTQPSPCADPYTVHRTPCTVHPTPYTVHRTPYTAILLLPLLLLLFSCQKPKERIVIPAFYHWQTRLELTLPEQGLVKRLGVQRLYVKFFDVDWDPELKAPVPLAPVELAPRTYAGLELAPAVFIANRTLERLPPEQVPGLADKIYGKIFSLAAQDSSLHIREVQLDCDWTGSTREAYFELLGRLRDKLSARGIALSATIRLHQARYPARTGVPPVGRGILMFYNMGQLEQWDEPNSILNLEAAEPYLKGYEPYPLPLGLALPLFRWAVLFRDGEMIKLINNLTEERLEGNPKYKALAPGRYEVVEGAFLEGHYLYPGDRIRMEAVEPEHLIAAAERLRGLPWPDTLELVFYHLDSTVVGRYEAKMLDGLGRILKGS